MVISSGPRRATNVGVLPKDLALPPQSKNPSAANKIAPAIKRHRGWRRTNFKMLLSFCMLNFLPLAVILDVKNAQIIPKLEPGNRVADECRGALVFRVNQGVLRVHLILGFGAGKLRQ